ncbi:NAD(P)-binding protein [Plenodomus tracheiphilus IPT5]|uniref:NAD(P)-binding protein n=1 Tax=Plenodomus tracheiphilus IPT5 TaxID=1408161 RepID=A0A6A7BAQ6_9PLEO|nr:NAD(P)-binding protein [Plenodomus tracheiphilus IPT5]
MATTPVITNVAWYGTGKIGLQALNHLASTSLFNITILVRKDPSTYTIPSTVKARQIDLTSHSSLVEALTGIDAVVVFSSFEPGHQQDILQIALINAAIAAGVKLFIPSEWAPDTPGGYGVSKDVEDGGFGRISQTALGPTAVAGTKRAVHNYLLARSVEGSGLSFVSIHVGLMPEVLGLKIFAKFDMDKRIAYLPDGGIPRFSIASHETLQKALVAVLQTYPSNKNSFLYFRDGETNYLEIMELIEKASGKPWTVESFSLAKQKKIADANLREGKFGWDEFVGVLSVWFVGGLTVWKNVDNERLGLEAPSDEKGRRLLEDTVKKFLQG